MSYTLTFDRGTRGSLRIAPFYFALFLYRGKNKKIFFEKNMAVLTVLTVLFSKTVDIQQTQKIF